MAHEQDCKIHGPQRFDDRYSTPDFSSLKDFSTEDLIKELRRRRVERKKISQNAKLQNEILVLEKQIEAIKKKMQ